MIITPEQLTQVSGILNEKGTYSCSLVRQRWSHALNGDYASIYGNIATFKTQVDIGNLSLNSAIVLAAELPNVNMFGGVCFQRLYIAQLGSILCEIIDKQCSVNENTILIENTQGSITITNRVKDSALFNIIFSLEKSDESPLYSLELTDEQVETFQKSAVECFDLLTKSIFLETLRDNF
jgi:hypothetical protein